MIAIPLIFIGHQTMPVGYSKISGATDELGFPRAGILEIVYSFF
jgi:hypothetical protein